jgi:hypothetical protein
MYKIFHLMEDIGSFQWFFSYTNSYSFLFCPLRPIAAQVWTLWIHVQWVLKRKFSSKVGMYVHLCRRRPTGGGSIVDSRGSTFPLAARAWVTGTLVQFSAEHISK